MLESGDHEGLWHLTRVGSGIFLVPPTGWWSWLSRPPLMDPSQLLRGRYFRSFILQQRLWGAAAMGFAPWDVGQHHWEGDVGLDPVGGFVLLPYGVHGQI